MIAVRAGRCCVPNPSGRKLYMSRQVTAAPTNEMAIGRKISDFAQASP